MTGDPSNESINQTPGKVDVLGAVDGSGSIGSPGCDSRSASSAVGGSAGDVAALAAEVTALLHDLASSPRPAGSAAEERARARCAAWLTSRGYSVADQPFSYSALPGRWGTPVLGVVSLLLLGAAVTTGVAGRPSAGLLLLAVAGLVLSLVGRWVVRQGILSLPLMRCRSVNLVATRGDRPPTVWLMAHLDSKSQPVPIAVRAAGVIGTLAVWGVTALLLVAGVAGLRPLTEFWWSLLAAGVVCALPIIASTVGGESNGALDNASGVAAVLGAAALLPIREAASVGIVITSAEELGLAGARAWSAGTAPAIALNCDGVDDQGEIVVMYSGNRPQQILRTVTGAAKPGEPVRTRGLVPGILTDHVALTAAGWSAVTVSRGTIGTLRRIHTRSDTMAQLRGDGLMAVASLLARSATRLATGVGSPALSADQDAAQSAEGVQ